MIVSQRRMNVVGASAKPEITPESHEGLGAGFRWPGSGSSDEKFRRISELETRMRDMQTLLAECKRQIEEMGEKERESTFKIRDLEQIIKDASIPGDEYREGNLASKDFVIASAKDTYGACMIQIKNDREDINDLRANKASRGDLTGLKMTINEKLTSQAAKIDLLAAKNEGHANAIIDQFHDSGVEFRKLVRRIDRLEVWKGQLEAGFDEMHHEGHSAIVHSGRHPRPIPDDHARHREPLYIMPPDDDYAEPYDAQSWDFDKVMSSMKANLAKH